MGGTGEGVGACKVLAIRTQSQGLKYFYCLQLSRELSLNYKQATYWICVKFCL
jgi:hypothetical protein